MEIENKNMLVIIAGAIMALIFIIISSLIRNTEFIWIQTRMFGLIAFGALFIALLLGELRLLSIVKADFSLFKFHTPTAIFSLFLVLTHAGAAVFDNFKWGKDLAFHQFLGFSFSDKWLTFLSLGAIAFYLMILVALTSHPRSIQFIRYKNWKIVHYLSYAAFIIAYIHSINLGTDLRHSALTALLRPLFALMFITISSLLVVRIVKSWNIFQDQLEVNLASGFAVLLIAVITILASQHIALQSEISDAKSNMIETVPVIADPGNASSLLGQSSIPHASAEVFSHGKVA